MRPAGSVMKLNGLPVYNAKRPVRIRVTGVDIRGGRSKKADKCPAARSCLRIAHVKEVRIHLGRTYLRVGNHWMRYLTSKPLRTEVVAFDKGGAFEPGFYLLGKMQPSKTHHTQQGGRTGTVTGKKRAKYHVVKNVRQFGAASGEILA